GHTRMPQQCGEADLRQAFDHLRAERTSMVLQLAVDRILTLECLLVLLTRGWVGREHQLAERRHLANEIELERGHLVARGLRRFDLLAQRISAPIDEDR